MKTLTLATLITITACSSGRAPEPAKASALEACTTVMLAGCLKLQECGAVLEETDAGLFCIDDCAAVADAACAGASGAFKEDDVTACASALGDASCGDVCGVGTTPAACEPLASLLSGSGSGVICDSACQ